ncbi:MAG: GNAT family N-acetyltransferase [Candidatus Cohnella colombiensis]|uniref:GNAT family N-acetyltransferase n=1 Tax=Candidatus Cohnella colombiensis TaxID=3121368 RepID=A0AA95JD83_9BACL|nr:MAG: GNAT family N-acetyltransferase [Cohnella sp.]
MFHRIKLNSDNGSRFQSLMFQNVYHRLNVRDQTGSIIAYGVEVDPIGSGASRIPVGAIVAYLDLKSNVAEVLSLFITEPYRKQGLATALAHEVERDLQSTSCHSLRFVYYAGKQNTAALEQFLSTRGWTTPVTEALIYHVDERIAQAAWLRERPLPARATFFPWSELSATDEQLLRSQEGTLYERFLSPFKSVGALASNSIGLRVEDHVVGWAINYQLSASQILYDCIYVHPDYQHSGVAFQLLSHSIRLQLDQHIPKALFTVNTTSHGMFTLAGRRLRPYAERISEKRVAYKTIRAEE